MTKKEAIKIFEEKKVRTIWDDETEEWYFSVVDVVAILTESVDSTAYWRKLKQRLKKEGNETVTNCHGLKMRALDGKMRITDVATTPMLPPPNSCFVLSNQFLPRKQNRLNFGWHK